MWRRNRRKVVVVIPAIGLLLLCSISLILAAPVLKKCKKICTTEKDRDGLLGDEKAILKKLEKERVVKLSQCPHMQMLLCHAQKLYLLLGTTKFQDRCVTREKLKDVIGKKWGKNHRKAKVKDQLRLIQKAVKKVTRKSTLPRKLKTLSAMVKAMDVEPEDLMVVKKGAEGADLKQRGSDIVRLHKLNQQIKLAEDEYLEKIKNVVGNVKEGTDIAEKVRLGSLSQLKCALGMIAPEIRRSKCPTTNVRKRHRLEILKYSFKFPKYCSNLPKLQAEKKKILDRYEVDKWTMEYILENYFFGDAVKDSINAKESFDTFYDIMKHQLCLPHTQHTFQQGRSNTIEPRNAKSNVAKRIAAFVNRQRSRSRRRLLTKGGLADENIDYEALWDEFTSMVQSNNKCRARVLEDVNVESDGTFSFECSEAKELCDCIVKVGETGVEPRFYAEDGDYTLELNVFRDGDYVSYEIMENGEALAYGDVNEGDVEDATGMRRRRRRLLQGGGHHGS